MLPSASPYSVGVPEDAYFAAEYPARSFPCQLFAAALASGSPYESEPVWFGRVRKWRGPGFE
jgi:hypothetical protein